MFQMTLVQQHSILRLMGMATRQQQKRFYQLEQTSTRWTDTAFLRCTWRVQEARLLLSHGADPNIGTVGSYTCYPIHAASSGLHYDVVKLLLEYNADVDVRDKSDETALHYAVSLHDTDTGKNSALVQLLLNAGADVNAADDGGKSTVCFATEKCD